jgi:hypothetical protein
LNATSAPSVNVPAITICPPNHTIKIVESKISTVVVREFYFFVLFARERAHDLRAGEIFLERGGQIAERLIHNQKEMADFFRKENGRQREKRNRNQTNQREHNVLLKQQKGNADEQKRNVEHFDRALPDKARERAHIFGATRHQLPGLNLVVITERQALNLVVQRVAKIVPGLIDESFGKVAPPKVKERAHQRDRDDRERDGDDRVRIVLGETVVNRGANERRRYERRRGNDQHTRDERGKLKPVRIE